MTRHRSGLVNHEEGTPTYDKPILLRPERSPSHSAQLLPWLLGPAGIHCYPILKPGGS